MSRVESTWVADEAHESVMAGPAWDYGECPDAAEVASQAGDLARVERDRVAALSPSRPSTPWGPGHPDYVEPPW